jgi:hypothetical protein
VVDVDDSGIVVGTIDVDDDATVVDGSVVAGGSVETTVVLVGVVAEVGTARDCFLCTVVDVATEVVDTGNVVEVDVVVDVGGVVDAVVGVTAARGLPVFAGDCAPNPTTLTARTRTSYSVPLARPVISNFVDARSTLTHVVPSIEYS